MNIAKDDEQLEGVTLEKMKVGTPCKLAFETKEHVVAWGTVFNLDIEGDNVKVAVNVMVDGDCAIRIPTKKGIYKMSQEMESKEFSKDMATFTPIPIQTAPVTLQFFLRMVEHMASAVQITMPFEVVQHNEEEKPNWRIMKYPKQLGVVECGYYVMRFMHDIILSKMLDIKSGKDLLEEDFVKKNLGWVEELTLMVKTITDPDINELNELFCKNPLEQ
ncbi:DNA topoisomerase 6 subunit A [Cucumis melo var. makuwa]|uniref:DNA topoisomerase 6 subunit A n=1 Tax=Cucumis melo var. makuwa TaxID=1194695 RepID=A0A5D3CVD8_CUCMM|nr:DNA topoisomerase 6 subunit A [Cucumis melo var. makuwa]